MVKPFSLFLIFSSLLLGCNFANQEKSQAQLVLKDSVNLGSLGVHLVTVFNVSNQGNRTFITDLIGGQIFGIKDGHELIYELQVNTIDKTDGISQPGHLFTEDDHYYILFPTIRKILLLDSQNLLMHTINLEGDGDLTIDKASSLFEFNQYDSSFYISLSKEASLNERYKNIPLIGKFNYSGKLIETKGNYPANYNDTQEVVKDLSPWKYSFFDSDGDYYYAVFNKNNVIYQFDSSFNLMKEIRPSQEFISEQFGTMDKLGDFKKHPSKPIFFIDINEYTDLSDGNVGVKVGLKWYNAATDQVGYTKLDYFFSIQQVTSDDEIILLDRERIEDAYFYFYDFIEKADETAFNE